MTTTTWIKGLVVAMGLSLTGGAALAAPSHGPQQAAYGHDRDDHNRWDPKDRDGRVDVRDVRLYREGKQKVQQGEALQREASQLLYKARFENGRQKLRLVTQAKNLKLRGERLEREGQQLLRRASR